MATITLQRNKTLPDSSGKSDFHDLLDLATATITNIVNADLSGSAGITDANLAQITTASKVSGNALYNIGSLPSGAGTISVPDIVSGFSLKNMMCLPCGAGQIPYYNIVPSLASGVGVSYNGSSLIGSSFLKSSDNQIIKAWANFAGATGTATDSFNCTTARDSTGVYTVTIGTDFASTAYAIIISVESTDNNVQFTYSNVAAGSFKIRVYRANVASDETAISFIAIGLQ